MTLLLPAHIEEKTGDLPLRPVGDRIAVIEDDNEQVRNGLHIPVDSNDPVRYGFVAALGEGRISDMGVVVQPTVQVGDRVAYHKHAGAAVYHAGYRFLLMTEANVLAVLRPDIEAV